MKSVWKFLILFVFVMLPAYAQDSITETAKVVLTKKTGGDIVAVVISYREDGSYPKSGWTTCDIIEPGLLQQYANDLKEGESREDYYVATYVKKGLTPKSILLSYQGELLDLKPWHPAFAKGKR